MQEQKHIIKGIVFRLVRKYIAGSTTESALEAIRKLNEGRLHTAVTLLNDHVSQPTKARYNANAYVQFIKQISRLNLNSDVSLRLTQMGYGLGGGLMDRNMREVMDAANGSGTKIWIESENEVNEDELLSVYRDLRGDCSSLGIEIAPAYGEDGGIVRLVKPKDFVKLRCHLHKEAGKDNRKDRSNTLRLYKSYIDRLVRSRAYVTVLDHNADMMGKIAALDRNYKKSLTFEAPMGFGGKRLKKLADENFNVSVYLPYGKDWVPYLINKLTEGRLKNIAIALLNGEKTGYEHG